MTAVVADGTDGIGRALADSCLERGHDVLIIGSSADKATCSAKG